MSNKMPFRCEKCGVLRAADEPHYCYVQPLWFLDKLKAKDDNGPPESLRLCFFDVETTQEQRIEINGIKCRKHTPNLICCEVICTACADAEIELPTGPKPQQNPNLRAPNCACDVFGQKFRYCQNLIDPQNRRLLQFNSFDGGKPPEDQFLEFLLTQGDPTIPMVIIGHNAAKFDLHLMLGAIYRRNINPRLTLTGLKIYKAEIKGWNLKNLLFKDSICFMPGALSRLYDTFAMENTGVEKKPPFPHLWNKRRNLNRPRKTLPPLKYYSIKRMKEGEFGEVVKWHKANKRQPFVLKKELVSYCLNDVQLLRIACLKFRKIILKLCPGLDPFVSCSTIAGLALKLWRTRFLRPNLLCNLPENGMRPQQLQSNEARRFFAVYTKVTGHKVQTADSRKGEYICNNDDSNNEMGGKAGEFRADGLIESATGPSTILEYNGCRYHGCVHCFQDRKMVLQGGKTAEDLYARTKIRKMELERRGFRVIEVWQCRWKAILKKNASLRKMWNEIELPPPPLNPRKHALRGGRVEPFRLYAEAGQDEVIEIYDIVSMYPSVMKNCRFPIGVPHVYGKEDLRTIGLPKLPWAGKKSAAKLDKRGFYMVRVLPPDRMPNISNNPNSTEMLPPFLPYRTKEGLLVFPLCAKCSDEQRKKKCRHSPMERSWVDALLDEDINLALELGYKILDFHELWHWPDQQWTDFGTGRDLFREYINELLKIKVEASGWPPHIKTEEQKRAFIEEYRQREGIELDPDQMILNKGLREIIKLLLNSLWGKLCQRVNMSSVKITRSAREFHEMVFDNTVDVLDAVHLNDHLDRVVFRKKEEFLEAPETNNVPIAACVTAHGRRLLYRTIMDAVKLENCLLYCDTDSIMVKRKIWQQTISEGIFLGDMTRELPDRRIQKIVMAGAKNYAYLHSNLESDDIKLTRKIRGFEMTNLAAKKLTFDAILGQVKQQFFERNSKSSMKKSIAIKYSSFRRTTKGAVYIRPYQKEYMAVYKKGIIRKLTDQILPFGYKSENE